MRLRPTAYSRSPSESSRTDADDRLPRASLGRVEGGDGFVEGRDGADVRPQSSVPHPLDDLAQLGTIGLDNEVDRQAVGGPCLARPDDGHQRFSGSNHARGPLPDVADDEIYLFRGAVGTTVMAMTVNPGAGVKAPDSFRDEGLYAVRFDLDGDAREELTFETQFGGVIHADGDGHKRVQSFEVRRATGHAALKGVEGELIVAGQTGEVVRTDAAVMAFAGLAPISSPATLWRSSSSEKAFPKRTGFTRMHSKIAKTFSPGAILTLMSMSGMNKSVMRGSPCLGDNFTSAA